MLTPAYSHKVTKKKRNDNTNKYICYGHTKVKIYSNDIGRLVMEQNDIMLSICMIVKMNKDV